LLKLHMANTTSATMSCDERIKAAVLAQSGNSSVSAEVDTTDILISRSDTTPARRTVALNEGNSLGLIEDNASQVGLDKSCRSASTSDAHLSSISSNDGSGDSASMEEEMQRMKVLQSYHILDTNYDDLFDSITSIASRIFKVPVSIVSLVDSGRYVLCFPTALAQLTDADAPILLLGFGS
jgi:hypothetical protein